MKQTEKNIKLFKIITGEVILGEVTDKETIYYIKKPVELRFEPMLGGLSFLPYMAVYLGKELDEISIKKDFIVHEFERDDIPVELEAKYREYISGIITPTTNPTQNDSTPSIQDLLKGGN